MSKSYILMFLAIGILLCGTGIAFLNFEPLRIGAISPLKFLIVAGGPLVSGLLVLIMARRAKIAEAAE